MSPTASTPDEFDVPTVSRRRVLAGAGAGLLALGPGVIGSARGTPAGGDVTTPSRFRRGLDTREALRSDTVRRLRRELVADGYRPRIGDAIVHRSSPEEGPDYRTVAIPFEHERDDAEAVILWTDDGPYPVQARRFVREDDDRVRMHATQVDGATATTSTAEVSPAFFGWFCWDVNWACVLSVAGAWAGSIGACAACISDPSKITCISCVGAVMAATGATLGCDWCD